MTEHNAGDLTAVVSADTPLQELQQLFAGSRQMFALDPPGDPTIGAVVAAVKKAAAKPKSDAVSKARAPVAPAAKTSVAKPASPKTPAKKSAGKARG